MSSTVAKAKAFGSITLSWMRNNADYWVEHQIETLNYFSVGDTYFVRMIGDTANWALYELCGDAETLIYVRLPTNDELNDIEGEYIRNCVYEPDFIHEDLV